MQNKHLEHPEDMVLSGDLNVLNWFTANSNISVKIDGSPAIVWGTNPKTNKFFVGTKSVFNKKLIKINHDHREIDQNHTGEVANILHKCLDNLPFTDSIFQGDFIGFGGTDSFLSNTIRYIFPEEINEEIIIAPHTSYDLKGAGNTLAQHTVARPISDKELISLWQDAKNVQFIRPFVTIDHFREDINQLCQFAKQIATLCEFPKYNQVARIKKQLNTCIREGIEIDDITQEALASDNNVDVNVLRLWKLVQTIKMDMLSYIEVDDDIECYIEEERCDHEGYVMSNEFGTFKIVNREGFSRANFNMSNNRN